MACRESDPRSRATTAGINWYDAWQSASIGPSGFWHHERPANHIRTASSATGLVARMVLALLVDHPGISTIVDIGAGDGRLLTEIAALAPRMRLIGLDVRPAPADPVDSRLGNSPSLPVSAGAPARAPQLAWQQGYWDVDAQAWRPFDQSRPGSVALRSVVPDGQPMAIVAAEWLDELPLVVAECRADHRQDHCQDHCQKHCQDRWRQVRVDPDGTEAVGQSVPPADVEWLDRWWPGVYGSRAESGRTRDRAWAEVIDCLTAAGGLAIMIDYGHRLPDRPAGGTLTGFQQGRQVPPTPSPAVNLTAHVAVDSVQQAGEAAGARTELLISQRDAVQRFLPAQPLEDRSPGDALARLELAGERRLLSETLGDHWWLVQSV